VINDHNKMPRARQETLDHGAVCVAPCAGREMALGGGAVPVRLNDGWPGIVSGVLKVFRDLPEAIAGAWGVLWVV
jgi:hypothetical protein